MIRFIYTVLFTIGLPFILLRLYWRGFKAPAYRERWGERLGFYTFESRQGVIWFHAVSLGETEAAYPVICAILAQYPEKCILVTTTTPTGSARLKSLLGDAVEHVYLPYDVPWVLDRFLTHFKPRMAVFLEKELWPNLFGVLKQRQVPIYLINARLSDRSAKPYRRIPSLIHPVLSCITAIAVQTEEDKANFVTIGAQNNQLAVLGNIKFDIEIPFEVLESGRQLRGALFKDRWVWILASTHQDEEEQLLKHYASLKKRIPQLLVMIAPRHPERFLLVKQQAEALGLKVQLRSLGFEVERDVDVYLADSLGELKMLYAASDVAFVGGSLVEVGGHNVLEPAAVEVPVIFGPVMFNFKLIAEMMLMNQAAIQCGNAGEIAESVCRLFEKPEERENLTQRARVFLTNNQGATQRVVDLISEAID